MLPGPYVMRDRVILFSVGAMDLLLAVLYVEGIVRGRPVSSWEYVPNSWEIIGAVAAFGSVPIFLIGGLGSILTARRPERRKALWVAFGIGVAVLAGTAAGSLFISGAVGRVPPVAVAFLLLAAGHIAIASLLVASWTEPDAQTRRTAPPCA